MVISLVLLLVGQLVMAPLFEARLCLVLLILQLLVANNSVTSSCTFQDDSYKKPPPDVICPTWHYPVLQGNDTYTCQCGDDLTSSNFIICKENPFEVRINLIGPVCVSYSEECNITVAGACPFPNRDNSTDFYISLPANLSELNDYMCGPLNRKGMLCGQCKEGYNPPVLSYSHKCVRCSGDSGWNWVVFCSLTLLPTTILFLVFMIFQVNVSAPPLSAFVFISQMFSIPLFIERIQLGIRTYPNSVGPLLFYKILTAIYGIWNLDFLRVLVPPYCLPGVDNSMKVLALEYLVAFYPLLLVTFVYIAIKLHARGTRIVVVMWKPFHTCFAKFRRVWSPNASVIKGFATFLVLSYWKLVYVSIRFLCSISFTSVYGEVVDNGLFYNDATVRMFHGQHLWFALIAIGVIVVFVIPPPLVLLLYPTKAARKFLQFFHVRTATVAAFMDVFQGYYKDGTGDTRDWRAFSAAYLLLRFFGFIVLCFGDWTTYIFTFPLIPVMWVLVVLVVLVGRPYKKSRYNFTDVFLFVVSGLFILVLGICVFSVLNLSLYLVWLEVIALVIYTVPCVFLACVCIWRLEKRHHCIKLLLRSCKMKYCHGKDAPEVDAGAEELPDRLRNPQAYE